MALIEIDGLPFLIAWWIFPWRTVSHNQMVKSLSCLLVNLLFIPPSVTSFALFIELDDGKIYRKALYLMVKNMVSG